MVRDWDCDGADGPDWDWDGGFFWCDVLSPQAVKEVELVAAAPAAKTVGRLPYTQRTRWIVIGMGQMGQIGIGMGCFFGAMCYRRRRWRGQNSWLRHRPQSRSVACPTHSGLGGL